MDRCRRTLLLALGILWLPPVPPKALAAGQAPKRVVVVHSYDEPYAWTQHINQGLRDALQGVATVEGVFYLDAKNQPDPEILRVSGQKVFSRIGTLAPDIVVTVDDAAQVYLTVPYLMGRQSPQVIFCGVNAPPSLYGFPADNVSGVRERWHCREGFALMKRILPEARRLAFLVEDSESGRYVIDDLLEDQRQNGPFALEVVDARPIRTFQQWQSLVQRYQREVDVLALGLYNSLIDEPSGKVVPLDTVRAWNTANNILPTMGFSDTSRTDGMLCGVLESGHEQGFLAGRMVREILLSGRPAGELPVRINNRGVVLVNLKTAERLRVRIPFEIIEAAGVVVR